MKKLAITLFTIFFFGSASLLAQDQDKESFVKASHANALLFFKNSLGENLRYVNGNTYYTYGAKVGGSAIFGEASFSLGSVVYEEIEYPNVQLMYDAYIDKLVSFTNTGAFSITTEKVSEFTLGSHTFLNIKNSGRNKNISSGYYELLYNGETKVYLKHLRELKFSLDKDVPNFFNPKTKLYINKQGAWYSIGNQSDLLKLFESKKKEITKYLKEIKLRFDKNPGSVAVEVVKFYETTLL